MEFFDITAVNRWLYIFTKVDSTSHVQVHCYDTTSGIWTNIPVFFRLDHEFFSGKSSVMFENKVYFVGSVAKYVSRTEYWINVLYEFNLVDDTVKRSTRPCPKLYPFHMSVVDVSTKLLEPDSTAPIYTEGLNQEEELASNLVDNDDGSDSDSDHDE